MKATKERVIEPEFFRIVKTPHNEGFFRAMAEVVVRLRKEGGLPGNLTTGPRSNEDKREEVVV